MSCWRWAPSRCSDKASAAAPAPAGPASCTRRAARVSRTGRRLSWLRETSLLLAETDLLAVDAHVFSGALDDRIRAQARGMLDERPQSTGRGLHHALHPGIAVHEALKGFLRDGLET